MMRDQLIHITIFQHKPITTKLVNADRIIEPNFNSHWYLVEKKLFVFLRMPENKDSKLFYSIGELTERYKVQPSTLHFWEKQFPELQPKRNKKGNRFYTEQDILLLDTIYYLTKDKGYTIKGARERLKTDRKKLERNATIRSTLVQMRDFLKELQKELDTKNSADAGVSAE
jgi:DNA-binding transcriptional MerR regulator